MTRPSASPRARWTPPAILAHLEEPAPADRSRPRRPPGHRAQPRSGWRPSASSSPRPASRASGSSPASAASTRPASTTTSPTAATARCARPIGDGPRAGHRGGHHRRGPGPRRRGVPRRQEVGRRRARGPAPQNIVCNADEAEPGTFKDRAILEEDPFSLVEAMTIAGFAVGAELGLPLPARRVPAGRGAHAERHPGRAERGLLGAGSHGRGFAFDIEIRRGGGAYICGEGTAIYESIEGKRGEPRNKAARSPPPACSRSRRSSTTSRRSSTSRASCSRAARCTRPSARTAPTATSCSASPATSRGRASTRRSSASPCGDLHRAGGRRARRARGQGREPRRGRGRLRRPGVPAHAAHLRGGQGPGRDPRRGRDRRVRRDHRHPRHPAPHRRVLPRRVVRPVRPVPRRHRAPGGAARAARGAAAQRHRSRTSWPCWTTSAQVLRDASICGLGQTANDAVRTGLRFAEVPA